jgi:hypothetical protein
MKHVVSIKELQQLVPETKSLEGKNFKDMKQLIEFVIREVEKSGKWEYVQYVSGNPSLFVIKEREVIQNVASNKYDMSFEIANHYNPQPAPETETAYDTRSFMPANNNENKKTIKSKEKQDTKPEPTSQPNIFVDNQKLFENTKMPW